MDDKQLDRKMRDLTLLYVEDEAPIREQMIPVFEARFKTVYVGIDGVQGLELYRQEKPDIIVTDIKMPHLSGLEMTASIRLYQPHIPVLIITAFSDLENLTRAIELGVDGFIRKPTKRAELLEMLRKATRMVINEREIRERDAIIQTVLGWHPFFSIISEKNHIEHVGNNLLQFLGYASKEEFIANHCNLDEIFNNAEIEECKKKQQLTGEALYEYIANNQDKDVFVYLKNRNAECRAYLLKCRYFEAIDLYFVAFLDPKHYVGAEDGCDMSKLCQLCDFKDLKNG